MVSKPIPVFAVVDDHEGMREAVRNYLLTLGYSVSLVAINGKDLLEQLEKVEHLPDICLLDLNMPEMNGYETTRRLRSAFPSIRILAYSQFAEKSQEEQILACGADAFLAKEASPEQWKKKLAFVASVVR